MPVQIQLRHDTAANWTSADPTLALGEAGVETDTGKLKFGDGSTAWTGLAYFGADLSSHTGDTSDAHDASAISIVDAGTYFTGTDVEAALQELGAGGGVSSHLADATDAHDASAISIVDSGTYYTGTEVEAALQEVGASIASLVAGGSGVTVQDEGTPLSTLGTTLNFVGSAVVASGTGATKTITITASAGATAEVNAAARIFAYNTFR